jgi:hypothetical protein
MLFRFTFAVGLLTLISVSSAVLEAENLTLRRRVCLQVYRLETLTERYAQLCGDVHRLGAPARSLAAIDEGRSPLSRPSQAIRPPQATSGRPAFPPSTASQPAPAPLASLRSASEQHTPSVTPPATARMSPLATTPPTVTAGGSRDTVR